MLHSYTEDLCCPTCGSALRLHTLSNERRISGRNPRSALVQPDGVLTCATCMVLYPVRNGIPILLVFSTAFHIAFLQQNRVALKQLSQFQLPSGRPEPGERYVQESFTDEWNSLQSDSVTFLYTDDELIQLHQRVWLQWTSPPQDVKRILNLGVGFGKETEILSSIVPGARIYGVDLNLSLLNRPITTDTSNIFFIIASVFHLPFRRGSFDLVYSQGVIHHTYSTKAAYNALQRQVRDGGHLFVWVYGAEDAFAVHGLSGILARLRWLGESIARPVIAVLPRPLRNFAIKTFASLFHPLIKSRVRHRDRWQFRHTLHLAFDYLGPRYAHRHAFNEVIEWFENDGFEVRLQSPAAYRAIFNKRLWGVGILGRRIATSSSRLDR